MPGQMRLDPKQVKSYTTKARLDRRLEELGFLDDRHMVVKTEDDRWTAIFPASNIKGGYLGLYSQYGFFTLG